MRDIRICYVGDSFVQGVGDEAKLGWTGRLSQKSDEGEMQITHYNLGIRGDTSSDILKRWEQEVALRLGNGSENYVVFSFGVNDTVKVNGFVRVSLIESMTNIRDILGEAKPHYNVLMVGPPLIDDEEQNMRIRAYDQAYANICKNLGVPYLSIVDSTVEMVDNIEKGYELLAQYVYDWDAWWFK
ncbi:MAG: hypothetical protein KU29_09495 [Sulfurovum sp. FS06-10]|nr:MAG: hypothetical protein KU29_09495 [Sulfurovum sp. FS06-10]